MTARHIGQIHHWNTQLKYGFIKRPGTDRLRDVFVHLSGCEFPDGQEPQIGDNVTFEIGQDEHATRGNKICALAVRLANGDEAPQQAPAGLFKTGDGTWDEGDWDTLEWGPEHSGSGAALAHLLKRDNREAK